MTNAELQKFVIRKLGITKESFYGDGSQDCGVAFDYQGKVYLVMPDITVHQCIPGGTHVANDYAEQLEKLLRGEQWDGTGLPPVGTECEIIINGGQLGGCEVLFVGQSLLVWVQKSTHQEGSGYHRHMKFRPLRTERDKAIEKLQQVLNVGRNTYEDAENLYDAIVAGKIDGLGKVG